MRLGAGRDPRVEERLRGVSGSCGNELVGRLTKRTVRTELGRPPSAEHNFGIIPGFTPQSFVKHGSGDQKLNVGVLTLQ